MKSIFKHTKAALFALLAMLISITMVFGLAACNDTPNNGDDEGGNENTTVITKYDATFNASITMGGAGPQSFAGVFSDAYVTSEKDDYTLTIIFKAAPLTVMGLTGTVFIDDAPENPKDNDGTIGWYKKDGTLVTDGITVTYSSGENYAATPSQKNVYYVQSIAFKVDELRSAYDLTLYFNSNMMGMQFAKDSYKATLNLDLTSGEKVTAITGLGVATRGEAPNKEAPAEEKYVKYGATLDGKVAMGPQEINFTENLLDGAYVIKKGEKHEITLIFKTGEVSIFANKMTAFLTTAETEGYGGTVTPVYGYYNGETLVTEGITLTYSDGENYVTNKNGSYYYVQSMTFAVDELEDSYNLSIYVLAGNENSVSGMQFPYTKNNGDVCNAVLSLDLTDTETVESIDNLLGVDTLGEAPQPDVKYSVTINGFTSKEGTATLDPQQSSYEPGTEVTLTVTPSSGYSVKDVSVNGEKIELDENGTYTFEVNENTEINVVFQIDFELPVKLWNATSDQASMAASAFEDNARITIYDGKITLYVYTKEMSVWGITAHLQEMQAKQADDSYEDAVVVSVDEEGNPNCFSVAISKLEEYIAVKVNPHIEMMGNTFLDARLKFDLTNVADFVWEALGETPPSKIKEYQVPIASLTSAAPLPAVQQAFAKAFGDYVTLIIEEDGSMKIRVQNQHMQIDMSLMGLGTFDANVAWVQGATVITTKEEVFSNVNGNLMAEPTQETITVPDVFEIAYSPDCNGVIELTIGVDFMAKMNNKEIEEYSTKITLTLDLSSLDLEELN